MTSAFYKKEKGCCLHEELLLGVRQTATLIAKRKVRQDSNTKLPFAGLVNINSYNVAVADSVRAQRAV